MLRNLTGFIKIFFGKNVSLNKGMIMVSLDKICRFKSTGGLEFRKIKAVNKVFLCKLVWKTLFEVKNFWV